ncbi:MULTISPECIES: hypothetical protein [Halorussus]|uniref:hypothetical protein n=1 Tax=Halorussus TaxID=1070314 RepID=UPI00209D7B0E|nr:hypothetical protein [Halorussus vallis]USZ77440.1 hypothetical protein NGM07_08930 [Halorussus vallis]
MTGSVPVESVEADTATPASVDALPDGGVAEPPELYPMSVRVKVSEKEVTWHASHATYEQLHNHPSGNLVDDIEDEAMDRDGSLFDVMVAKSGAYWLLEVDD